MATRLRPLVAAALVVAGVGLLLGCVLVFPRYLVASDVDHAGPAEEGDAAVAFEFGGRAVVR